ncbi:PilN domain-containing protein [Pseudoalteromonas gelatinilytica]
MLSLMIDLKNKIQSKVLSYYNGELYCKKQQDWKVSKDEHSLKILIVSPSFYTQTEKKYPIRDRKELSKLLKLQQSDGQLSLIHSNDEHSTYVTQWKFDKCLPKAWLYLPESFLIAHYCEPGQILEIEESEKNTYYFTNFEHGFLSAKKSNLVNSVERFAVSSGVQCKESLHLSFADKLNIIQQSITKIKPKHWLVFSSNFKELNWWSLAIKAICPAISLVVVYIFISSIYLYGLNTYYSKNLEEKGSNINRLLWLQQELEQKQDNIAKLQEFLIDKPNFLSLWLELVPLFEYVDIDSIRINNARIMFRGQAKQATQIMELLSKSPNVADVKFDSPVSKVRNEERFNISFTLKNHLVLEDKVSNLTKNDEGQSNE